MKRSMTFTSARAAVAVALTLGALGVLASACGRGRDAEDPSGVDQYGNPYGQQGQYPQQPGQYPQQQYPQQQYPQQQYPQDPNQYPQQQPAAAPSPLALPCQNDMICGTHKCNMQTGRCAFPCAATTDCAAGFSCMGAGGPTAICIPGGQ